MADILKTAQAEADLDDIWFYIAQDNIAAADRLIDAISEKCYLLANTPYSGRDRSELLDGVRSFPVGRYVIFYRVVAGSIEIIRVLHASRDIDRQW